MEVLHLYQSIQQTDSTIILENKEKNKNILIDNFTTAHFIIA